MTVIKILGFVGNLDLKIVTIMKCCQAGHWYLVRGNAFVITRKITVFHFFGWTLDKMWAVNHGAGQHSPVTCHKTRVVMK